RDLLLGNPRQSRLSIDIELPPGHEVSHLPADLDLESKHLRFRFRARQEGNRLRIERVLVTRSPRVPPEDYPAYKVLVDRIEQFRDKRILLRQTEEVQ
ncbi:MAG: hypothetical protein ACE5GW_12960, partial [Planctomycetota bacterium]